MHDAPRGGASRPICSGGPDTLSQGRAARGSRTLPASDPMAVVLDLLRNDLSIIAESGSVRVPALFEIESYPTVHQMTSTVTARLRPGHGLTEILRALFPCGSVTGAPKIRAMEIIDELEPVKRGVYGGAGGYLAWNGNMDTAIAIRTMVLKGGVGYVQAGGGIVADSDPESEYQESVNKAKALVRAAEEAVRCAAGRD